MKGTFRFSPTPDDRNGNERYKGSGTLNVLNGFV